MRRCKHVSGVSKMIDVGTPLGEEPSYVELKDYWGDGYAAERKCEYGNCMEFCCPVCGCNKYGGVGPIGCPCDDTVAYHDMRRKPPVAVKPGISTRRRRRTRKL